MFVLSRHLDLVSGSFTALPESTTLLPDQHAVTNAAVFWAVVPLTGTPSTNHAVGPFVGMIFLMYDDLHYHHTDHILFGYVEHDRPTIR